MDTPHEHLSRYFDDVLRLKIHLDPWEGSSRLPMVFRDSYEFVATRLLDSDCLFMVDQNTGRTAATIRKHLAAVQDKWRAKPHADDRKDPGFVIYVTTAAGSDERLRLIEQNVPFVIPGNQMYLPMLGMDLREHFRKVQEPVTRFSPSTQAAIILLLVEPNESSYDAVSLANRLNYSKMTTSRAFNELLALDLGLVQTEGRARVLKFGGDRKELWNKCIPLMETPVRHRQTVLGKDLLGVDAGLHALASRSMLAKPPGRCLAVSTDQWSEIKDRPDVRVANEGETDAVEIQMWSYDPSLFASDEVCDPFSLYLALKDDTDERVEAAIDEMMEGIQW